MAEGKEEAAVEPKECPRGHGPMRMRTRVANAPAYLGRKGARAEPVTEWVCPRCGRTEPFEQ